MKCVIILISLAILAAVSARYSTEQSSTIKYNTEEYSKVQKPPFRSVQ